MSLSSVLLINLVFVTGLMVCVWLISLRPRDVSIVDIFWGLGFVAIAWLSLLVSHVAAPHGFVGRTTSAIPRNR